MSNAAHEDRVRRFAKSVGWRISKSRVRHTHLNNRGAYMLVDENNVVLTGADFGASLEECAYHMECHKRS